MIGLDGVDFAAPKVSKEAEAPKPVAPAPAAVPPTKKSSAAPVTKPAEVPKKAPQKVNKRQIASSDEEEEEEDASPANETVEDSALAQDIFGEKEVKKISGPVSSTTATTTKETKAAKEKVLFFNINTLLAAITADT